MRAVPFVLVGLIASGCGGNAPSVPDATTAHDAAVADAAPDAARDASPDATPDAAPDASLDAASEVPLAGFGAITGSCGILGEAELTGGPASFYDEITFATRYHDPADRDQLTAGSVEMLEDGNAGGSSVFSEVFAYEVLARCELATFLKSENEIIYDTNSKKTDLLVAIDGHKIGVSVTRAVKYPFDSEYTVADATTLINRKLDDILLSTASVSAADRWDKQILAVLAYSPQHAASVATAYAALDDETRADTILLVTVTTGDDLFIYTDE